MSTPETSAIVWGNRQLSYNIRRSARRKKTVAVTVEPSGSVLVIAPERLATARLDAIVTRKAEWIVGRLRRAEGQAPRASPREFVSGESVRYLGRHYRLKVDPHATGEAKLRGGWLHVPVLGEPQQTAHVRAALVSWFRRQAAERLPERVEAWRSKVGTPMPRVIVADQQKRWGSCNHRGTIRLNWRIIQARCGSSTMSSSTSWCISCTAATAVTTGRRSDGLCRTTSGAERNCGSAEPGWRGRNNSGFLLQRGH